MIEDFPPDMADGIVSHMNDDHASAVLAITRVQGNLPAATSSTLLSISPHEFVVMAKVGEQQQQVSIVMEPPIAPVDTVRTRLMEMTRSARAALDTSTPDL